MNPTCHPPRACTCRLAADTMCNPLVRAKSLSSLGDLPGINPVASDLVVGVKLKDFGEAGMNHRFIIPSLLLVSFALLGQAQTQVFNRNLLVGSWKVNWEKSKLEHPGAASQIGSLYRQYSDYGDGFMLHTMIAVDATERHAQIVVIAAVKYDGKEYPTYAGKRLASVLSTGKQPGETVAFKVLDAYMMEWTDRTYGKLNATGTVALSRDSKTMTDTARDFNPEGKQVSINVFVYEKQ